MQSKTDLHLSPIYPLDDDHDAWSSAKAISLPSFLGIHSLIEATNVEENLADLSGPIYPCLSRLFHSSSAHLNGVVIELGFKRFKLRTSENPYCCEYHSRRKTERPSQINGGTYSQSHGQRCAEQKRKRPRLGIPRSSRPTVHHGGAQALPIPIDDNNGPRQPPYGSSPPRSEPQDRPPYPGQHQWPSQQSQNYISEHS